MAQCPLAHDIVSNGAVRHLCADIERVLACAQIVDVLRKRFPPPPFDAFIKGRARNVFDPLHQFDHAALAARRAGRKPNAAIPHDHTGDAMAERRIHHVIPADLAIVVRVDINPAGAGIGTRGINGFLGLTIDFAHADNEPLFDCKIARHGLTTQTVDQHGVFDEVIKHGIAFLL